MKITNHHNLPDAIVKAIGQSYPPKPNRLSVTRLIDSPYLNHLLVKHWDELEEDVSDRLWALLGKSVHYVLEKGADVNSFAEEKLEIIHNGITIVCVTDNYRDKIVSDYKVTSVWHYVLGDGKDWERQLNCNAWCWRKKGFDVESLKIHAMLRDWQKSKVGNDYPPIPFVTKIIPPWSFEQQTKYIEERINLHIQKNPPPCTAEERWERPTTWAVMKKGRKSALRVLDAFESAWKWCAENGHTRLDELVANISIQERKGECVRCKSYCPVKNVCEYAQNNL